MGDAYTVVRPDDVDQEPLPESGVHHRKLTAALGCLELRINTVTLAPGDATAPHTHERQEEVYLALDGGTIRVDDEDHELPPGGLVRFAPGPVRSVANRSEDETHTWLMIGAPPTGTVEDFGDYVMPDEDR